ncbi:acetylxylan esterase [Propionibacteriaceae bacterium G1746]|uniref:acetylxylan esterase n=1 Tax=Aestuariimicrobium sp. G57 TaxID=3418485 RepID=UPI003C29DFFD
MAFFDLPLDELRAYRPAIAEPDDFEEFWRASIAEVSTHDLAVEVTPIDNRQSQVDAFDISFAGWGGARVRGWLLVPAGATSPRPGVVHFVGYNGGRGLPLGTPWVADGNVQLIMDTRGQGWNTMGIFDGTDDDDPAAGASSVSGWMTRGIRSRETYFYRRVFIDALRAVQVARTLPQVDPSKLFTQGGSQGGGIAIAATGLAQLAGVSLSGAMIDVPFLCHFNRAMTLVDTHPYKELSGYLRSRPTEEQAVANVLSYFDGVNLAKRALAPTMFSVGLMDQICPPSTVFAAYNQWGALHEERPDTDIRIYSHAGHEGGRELQVWEHLGWMHSVLKGD